jgi:predicted ATPase/DNA-binding CsgD family transcriptional regulator
MDDFSKHTTDESFTARELEILRLMALGLSNREIADKLVVAHETVRWYTKQIYSKLDAHGRVLALIRARELGLLDHVPSASSGDAALRSAAPSKHNLPTPATHFVGRRRETAEVKRLLQTSRLLTLTGAGGTGKTRLALRVVSELLDEFADGVYFVDLAPLSDHTLVAKAVAVAIGVMGSPQEPLPDTLKRALAERELLLLLDNFEQVIEAAPFVSELLAAAPRLKVLVTSREVLRLSGEQGYPVPPLSLPSRNGLSIQQIIESEAVALFVQRVQMMLPQFEIDHNSAPAVAQICTRLDGLPLAIELAAARSKLLSPQAMLSRLDSRLTTLTGGLRDAPQRQQTLRGTLDWSYDLLDEGEKMLFARLAVFRGGCSLEAIEFLCDEALPSDLMDVLASLVDKSLVQRKETRGGELRFVMLETIHEYAHERLEERGEGEAVRDGHSAYFANFMRLREADLKGKRQQCARQAIETDFDNIRQAWYYTVQQAQIVRLDQFLYALNLVAYQSKQYSELLSMFTYAVETLVPIFGEHRNYGELLVPYGQCLDGLGQLENAEIQLRRALAIAQTEKDVFGIAQASLWLARVIDPSLSKREEAWQLCENSIHTFKELGDDYELANALHYRGYLLWIEQKHHESLELNRQVLEIRRRLGDDIGVASSLYNIVGSLYFTNPIEAETEGREVLTLFKRLNQPFGVAISTCRLAAIELYKGNVEIARLYGEDSLKIARDNGFAFIISDALVQLAWIDIASDRFRAAEERINQDKNSEDDGILTDHALVQCFIHLGLQDWPAAKRKLVVYLQLANASRDPISILGMGLIAAAEGRTEHGVELISQVMNEPTSKSFRMNMPLVIRHLQAIKASLREEAYAAAWERGNGLDLEAVITELLKEKS